MWMLRCVCRWLAPGPRFNIKMTSYQYRKSHCGDKTILRPSYLHNGISYTGKMSSLYWIGAQDICDHYDVMSWGGGYKANFLHYVIFRIFQYHHNTCYLLNITFIFDRCRRSLAAVAPVKYKCDSNNLRGSFGRSKILLTEKLTDGDLVTPTPGRWTSVVSQSHEEICLFEGNQIRA